VQKYVDNPHFQEFLNREVDHTAVYATMEELAEFAFGSMEEAVKVFNERRKSNETI